MLTDPMDTPCGPVYCGSYIKAHLATVRPARKMTGGKPIYNEEDWE